MVNQTTIEFHPFDPIDEAIDVTTGHRAHSASRRAEKLAAEKQLKCPACGAVIGRCYSTIDRAPINIQPHDCPHGSK